MGDNGVKVINECTQKMYDIVRYTSVIDNDNLINGYNGIVELLSEKGYNLVRVKNTFTPYAMYKGINTIVKTPSGYLFELQFHTSKSLEVKEINHKLYEEYRLDATSIERKKELELQMRKNNSSVDIPFGADAIISFEKMKGE